MFKKRGVNFVFAFVLIAILMMGFVVAQAAPAPATSGSGTISGTFTSSGGAGSFKATISNLLPSGTGQFFNENGTFAHILVFALVGLIIYSLTPFLPFLNNRGWISLAVSIITAILATLWLKESELQAALFAYGPMAITITAIIPFFAVAAIAKRSFDKGHIFFSKVIWIIFLVVLFERFLVGFADDSLSTFAGFTYLFVTVISLLMLFGEHKAYGLMERIGGNPGLYAKNQSTIAVLKSKIAEQTELLGSASTDKQMAKIEGNIERLQKALKRAMKLS